MTMAETTCDSGTRAGVFILTGFLGAGKTTLLKRILGWDEDLSRTVVVVNEFGKVGIDGSLIRRTAASDIVELSSGCICCSLKIDLIQTLTLIRHRFKPERVLIEATGVADPLAIIDVLKDRGLRNSYRLSKTITVIDADFWEARDAFGEVFFSQLRQADLILLNKIDTVDEDAVAGMLKEIHQESPDARVVPTEYCRVDPDVIWSDIPGCQAGPKAVPLLQAYSRFQDVQSAETGISEQAAGSVPVTAQAAGFVSFSFETPHAMDEGLFETFLETVPLELFRIKGPVRFSRETRLINFVGGRSQWLDWEDTRDTCLVLIGWNVDQEEITTRLTNCLSGA